MIVLDLNTTAAASSYSDPIRVLGMTTLTASIRAFSGSWSAAVVEVQRSNDGVQWESLSSAVTFTADSTMTSKIDVRGIAWVRFAVTTANGATGLAVVNHSVTNDQSDIVTPTVDSQNRRVSSIGACFNGLTATPTLGSVEVSVPFTGTITKARIIADAAGSASVDVLKSTYAGYGTVASIAAAAKPTLSSVIKNEDSTLTGWTTAVTAGDIIRFTLESVTTCTRVAVILEVLRT